MTQSLPIYATSQCLAPKTQLKETPSIEKALQEEGETTQINIEELLNQIDQHIDEGLQGDKPEEIIMTLKSSQKEFFLELEENSEYPETLKKAINILLWDLYQTRRLERDNDPILMELLSSSERIGEEVSLSRTEKFKLSGFSNKDGFETLEWYEDGYDEDEIPEYYYSPFKNRQMSSIFVLGRGKRVVLQQRTPYVRLYEKGKQIYKKTKLTPVERRRFSRLVQFPPYRNNHPIARLDQSLEERLLETTALEKRYLQAARCFISLLDKLYFEKKFSTNPFSLNEEDLLDIFSKMNIKPGDTVLEIGPGPQPISLVLAIIGAKVYLLESPKVMEGPFQAFIERLIKKITPLVQRSQGSITLLPGNITEPDLQSFPKKLDHVIALDVLRPNPHPLAMIHESEDGETPYSGITNPQSLENAFSYIFSTQPRSFYLSHPDTTNSIYGSGQNPYTKIFKDQNFQRTPLEVPIPRSNLSNNGYIYLAPEQDTQMTNAKSKKLKANASPQERLTNSIEQLKVIQPKSEQVHEIALSLSEAIQGHPSWRKASKPEFKNQSRFSFKRLIRSLLKKAA